jgi:hypothetical protein
LTQRKIGPFHPCLKNTHLGVSATLSVKACMREVVSKRHHDFFTLKKLSNSWCRPVEYDTTCLKHIDSIKRVPSNLNFVTRGREKAA